MMHAQKMEAPRGVSSGRRESVGAGLLGGGGCGGDFGFFAGFAGSLDAGRFTAQVAQVIEAGAADVALAGNFDGGDRR